MLAGVSIDYYTRLERGHIHGASESVLDAIARALQLDDVERAHLFGLARTATAPRTARGRKPVAGKVRESVQRVLDNMYVPAIVSNAQQDLIAANLLGRAMFAPISKLTNRIWLGSSFSIPARRTFTATGGWPAA